MTAPGTVRRVAGRTARPARREAARPRPDGAGGAAGAGFAVPTGSARRVQGAGRAGARQDGRADTVPRTGRGTARGAVPEAAPGVAAGARPGGLAGTRGAGAAARQRGRSGRSADAGQVSVELLGITPLILLTLLLVWQFVLLGYTFTLAGNAADEAARAAAVGRDPAAAARSDLPSAWASGASVSTATGADGVVTARVALRVPVLVPGFVSFPFTVDGRAGAVKETP